MIDARLDSSAPLSRPQRGTEPQQEIWKWFDSETLLTQAFN